MDSAIQLANSEIPLAQRIANAPSRTLECGEPVQAWPLHARSAAGHSLEPMSLQKRNNSGVLAGLLRVPLLASVLKGLPFRQYSTVSIAASLPRTVPLRYD